MNEPINATIKQRHAPSATHAVRPRSLELRGHKVSWVGIESDELLQRGCDHGAWLQRIEKEGLRHVLIPLNGMSEDSCMFARKHILRDGRETAFYDLEHRDEGFFTRLKFLIEAAADSGVLIGLSLFDAALPGPLAAENNSLNLSLEDNLNDTDSRLAGLLTSATDWVCSAVRNAQGVYMEVFRHASGPPRGVERTLTAHIAATLSHQGEDLSPERSGPWVQARGVELTSKKPPHIAPLKLALTLRPEPASSDAPPNFFHALELAFFSSGEGGPNYFMISHSIEINLLRFEKNLLSAPRADWPWRAFFRGLWPVVALHAADKEKSHVLASVGALARFSNAWTRGSELRPTGELFRNLPEFTSGASAPPFAAEDGLGRYFVYFNEPPRSGVRLALPAGLFRISWVDPLSGKRLDKLDGIEGCPQTSLPGLNDPHARLLIIEPTDAADTLAVL